jgi:hypothetical protein
MVEQLSAAEATVRVEYYHLAEEIELYLVHEFESLTPVARVVLALQLLQAGQHEVVLYAGLLDSHDLHDLLQLANLAFPLEKNAASDHKMEDTAQRPHIHLAPILLAAQQQLGRSVEQRTDHVGHLFLREL